MNRYLYSLLLLLPLCLSMVQVHAQMTDDQTADVLLEGYLSVSASGLDDRPTGETRELSPEMSPQRPPELSLDYVLSPAEHSDRLLLSVSLENRSDIRLDAPQEILLSIGPGLGETPVEGLGIAETLYSFVEPYAYQDGELQRFPDEGNNTAWQRLDGVPDWAGLQSRYYTLLVEPLTGEIAHFRYRTAGRGTAELPPRYLPEAVFSLGLESLPSALDPGEAHQWRFTVYAGPKTRSALQGSEGHSSYEALLFPALWEWMRLLSFALLWLLSAIHALIPSWGLAIILLAVLVRLLMYPVARRALQSQAEFAEVQKVIQPEMRRIKREYSGGEQSEMILDLYKQHNVSPLAGLKPLLIVMIQIPVFISLFHVLGSAYELRDAPFLWVETLAEPDRLFGFGANLPILGAHFNLLPFLMAFTTLLTIRLSPAPAVDATARRRQNITQGLMAIGFLLLFYPFPAGMVLYWTMANVLHLLQHLLVDYWRKYR